jgi:hypothetical protein
MYVYLSNFDFVLTFDAVSYFTVRKKIRLKIKDQRLSFNGNIKRPYYLFIEMGEKRFVFSNKVKAKKWLVSFENDLNSLTQELIEYFPKLYNYNVCLSLNMDFPEQKRMRDSLDFWMERYWKIYNSNQDVSIGRELNGIFAVISDQLLFYKKVLGKNNRNQNLLNQAKIDMKHIKYLGNDVDKTLKCLKEVEIKPTEKLSENFLRIA